MFAATCRLRSARTRRCRPGPSVGLLHAQVGQQTPFEGPGPGPRVVDSSNFPVSKTISAALLEVKPGAIRELHWHPNADEWQYYLSGEGRMTVFASGGKARTFDYRGGDVGYVPFAMGHYIENTGEETLRIPGAVPQPYLSGHLARQWMAMTPPELLQAHLNLPDKVIAALPKAKQIITKCRSSPRSSPWRRDRWTASPTSALTLSAPSNPET